ncbi:hypothetical protein HDE_13274 [Halotydeus destructor]|nr:hypothetical protein HDE_13274 [Halotydeus destructor]
MTSQECCICLLQVETAQQETLSCNHVFHQQCITRWFNNNEQQSCPTCRNIHVPPPPPTHFAMIASLLAEILDQNDIPPNTISIRSRPRSEAQIYDAIFNIRESFDAAEEIARLATGYGDHGDEPHSYAIVDQILRGIGRRPPYTRTEVDDALDSKGITMDEAFVLPKIWHMPILTVGSRYKYTVHDEPPFVRRGFITARRRTGINSTTPLDLTTSAASIPSGSTARQNISTEITALDHAWLLVYGKFQQGSPRPDNDAASDALELLRGSNHSPCQELRDKKYFLCFRCRAKVFHTYAEMFEHKENCVPAPKRQRTNVSPYRYRSDD